MNNYYKTIAAIAMFSVVSFCVGYVFGNNNTKHYQAACILSDCCHNMVDNIGVEAEEIYYDYIDNLDCYPDVTITREEIERYGWSY